jgi:hypothetical protein
MIDFSREKLEKEARLFEAKIEYTNMEYLIRILNHGANKLYHPQKTLLEFLRDYHLNPGLEVNPTNNLLVCKEELEKVLKKDKFEPEEVQNLLLYVVNIQFEDEAYLKKNKVNPPIIQ